MMAFNDCAAQTVEVRQVPGSVVAEDFKIYRPLIEASMEYETEAIEIAEIFQHLRMNHWLCLIVVVNGKLRALCICEQQKKRKGYALEIMMLAGEGMSEWLDHLLFEVVAIAEEFSCNALTLNGRLGWLPILKQYGFEPQSQTLRMEI